MAEDARRLKGEELRVEAGQLAHASAHTGRTRSQRSTLLEPTFLWDRSRVRAEIATIATPELGDRSYVILAGAEAVAVDPQRDIDRVMAVLDEHGSALRHVLETHIHNDYVSGGADLCRVTGATTSSPPASRSGTRGGRSATVNPSPWAGRRFEPATRRVTPPRTCPMSSRRTAFPSRRSPGARCCSAPSGGPTSRDRG